MQILTALALAIVPVLNSFMILFILACICEPNRARHYTTDHHAAPQSIRYDTV